MSGLKVADTTGGANTIDVDGYINFIDEIFGSDNASSGDASFDELAEFSSNEVVELLAETVQRDKLDSSNTRRKIKVLYQKAPGGALAVVKPKKIRVVISYDDEKNRRGKRRYVVNLPRENPMEQVQELQYLDDYIAALNGIGDLVDKNGVVVETAEKRKRKFLYGVMLLTRCM